MASILKIKRSSVQGKAPTTSDIQTGELALNTRDGKLFSSDGSAVFEIGANVSSLSVSSNNGIKFYEADGTSYVKLTGPSSLTTDITLTLPNSDGTADQILSTDGAGNMSWVDPTTSDSGGYTRGTLSTFPTGDYFEGGSGTETYIGELADEAFDAFGISLGAVYDTHDPTGRMVTQDLGAFS